MLKRPMPHASAKVVDGNLIISLPNAKNPIVWRMALGEARAAALEVVPRQDEYILILKTAKGDSSDIAPFDSREQATGALMTIAHAMENAGGQIKAASAQHAATPASTTPAWKWMIPLACILLALFFFTKTNRVIPDMETATSSPAPATNGDIGVPLSADSYLGGM